MTRRILLALALFLLVVLPALAEGDARREEFTVTTDAAGDVTAYSPNLKRSMGRVIYIRYPGGFDATADFTITCELTTEGLWTESNVSAAKIVAPSKAIQDQVGVDRTQYDYIWCVNQRVKVVVAQGGNAKSVVFEIGHF